MSLTFSIDPEARLVTLSGARIPDFEEWQGVMRAVLRHPEFQPGFDFLTDRRDAAEAPTADYLRRAVGFLDLQRDALGSCRWALVVTTPASFGMGRMAEALCGDTSVTARVFTDLGHAHAWLGILPVATPA